MGAPLLHYITVHILLLEALSSNEIGKDAIAILVALAGVSHVGEYLSQRLLAILLNEATTLGESLFLGIEAAYILLAIILVHLVVNASLDGQTIDLRRYIGRIAHGERCYRHYTARQLQYLGYLRGVVGGSTQITTSQSVCLGSRIELLCNQ